VSRTLRIICGPTAAGKSALAIWLAERHGATIIGADSRQVYRGFDVGTAKPGVADLARVPHLGIDVVEPTDQYSAARWAADATCWIDEAVAAGRVPLIVGGTGLYLRALISPLFEEPRLDPERRDALRSVLDRCATPELRRLCERLDPHRAELGRTQLQRAVEIALLTGRRLSDLHLSASRAPSHTARYLVVDPGPALGSRIARRAAAMLSGTWQDEVRRLRRMVPADAPAWKATGYRTVVELVEGRVDHHAALDRIVIETRQYAKRQRTWFRHQLPPEATTRVSPDDPRCLDVVEQWWGREASP
jgi:tRNA dimethylallyltransferase